MCRVFLGVLLFLSLLLPTKTGFAKVLVDTTKIIQLDTSKIEASTFDRDAMQVYKNQNEFKYDEAAVTELSMWDRFWMRFWNIIGKLFEGAASNPVSKNFFIFLGIAIVVFIVIKLIGSEKIFSKKSKETPLPYDILNDDIHEIDYEAELYKLLSQEKYRFAVRLLYLQCLKKMSDAEIIQWQPDKTNHQYLTEIENGEVKSDFNSLTLQYDYIWYGDFPIDQNSFNPINQSFKNFNTQFK